MRDWLGRACPKWPILCRVGCKTSTQLISQSIILCVVLLMRIIHWWDDVGGCWRHRGWSESGTSFCTGRRPWNGISTLDGATNSEPHAEQQAHHGNSPAEFCLRLSSVECWDTVEILIVSAVQVDEDLAKINVDDPRYQRDDQDGFANGVCVARSACVSVHECGSSCSCLVLASRLHHITPCDLYRLRCCLICSVTLWIYWPSTVHAECILLQLFCCSLWLSAVRMHVAYCSFSSRGSVCCLIIVIGQ